MKPTHRGLWDRVGTIRVDFNRIDCLKGILYYTIKTIKAFGSQKVIFGDFWLGIGHNPVNIHTLGECLALSAFLLNFI